MIAAIVRSWALLLGVALLMLGNGLQGTLLGVRASLEGFATAITGVLMSGYFVGFLAGSLLAPKLVGRVGHARTFAAFASLASTAILVHAVIVDPVIWTLMRLVSGFCYAGLYVVAESWLNEEATNETRGQLLSVYMVILLGGMGLGQILLNLADPTGPELFILVSVLISIGLVPMLLSVGRVSRFETPRRVSVRELYRVSPTGVLGIFATVMAQGGCFGMGAVYAREIGLSLAEVSVFMSLFMIGGIVAQWPIGRLSDFMDRRRVLTVVTFLATAIALAATLADLPGWLRFALFFAYGGMAFPMYSVCIAYVNDYLEPEQMVEASGTLVLVGGIGASVGPLAISLAMQGLGPGGFFACLAVVHVAIGLFALYRMTIREAVPVEEQGAYLAVARTTPMAAAMYAEAAAGDGSEDDEDDPAAATPPADETPAQPAPGGS